MKPGWKLCKLDDVKTQIPNAIVGGPFGSNLVTNDYRSEGVPVIRGHNLSEGVTRFDPSEFVFVSEEKAEELSANIAVPDDVIFTQRGTLGQVGIVPNDLPYKRFVISQSQMKLTCDRAKAEPLFIYYCFRSQQMLDYIHSHAISTGVPHTNLGILKETPLLLPPLPIQRRIADILGALDDKIECNRRINRTLEAMAQALCKHWFVDKDFETTTLGEMCEILMGQSPSSDHYNDMGKGLPFHQGVTNFGWRFPRHVTFCDELARIAEAGSILFSVRAPVGRINITDRRVVIGRGVASMNHKRGWNSFLLYQLKEKFTEEDSIGSGTIFNSVTKSELAKVPVVSAPNDLAGKFNAIVAAYDKQIEINERESETLTRTRDYLLPKLLSGEIAVKEGALQM